MGGHSPISSQSASTTHQGFWYPHRQAWAAKLGDGSRESLAACIRTSGQIDILTILCNACHILSILAYSEYSGGAAPHSIKSAAAIIQGM